jgi:hypothetical protein
VGLEAHWHSGMSGTGGGWRDMAAAAAGTDMMPARCADGGETDERDLGDAVAVGWPFWA